MQDEKSTYRSGMAAVMGGSPAKEMEPVERGGDRPVGTTYREGMNAILRGQSVVVDEPKTMGPGMDDFWKGLATKGWTQWDETYSQKKRKGSTFEYQMGLIDTVMVGFPTFGEKVPRYDFREQLKQSVQSGKTWEATALEYLTPRVGETAAKERVRAVRKQLIDDRGLSVLKDISSRDGLLAGSMIYEGVRNLPEIVRAGAGAVVKAGQSAAGIETGTWGEYYGGIERAAAATPVTRAGDGVARLLQYFVPGVGAATIASDTVDVAARAKSEGLVPAMVGEVRDTLNGINVFEPGLKPEEVLVRSLGAFLAVVGARHGLKTATAAWRELRGGTLGADLKAAGRSAVDLRWVFDEVESGLKGSPVTKGLIDGVQRVGWMKARANEAGVAKAAAEAVGKRASTIGEVEAKAASEILGEGSDRGEAEGASGIGSELDRVVNDPAKLRETTDADVATKVEAAAAEAEAKLREMGFATQDDMLDLAQKRATAEPKEAAQREPVMKTVRDYEELVSALEDTGRTGREAKAVADAFHAVFETAAGLADVPVDSVYRRVFAGMGMEGDRMPMPPGTRDSMFVRAKAMVDGAERSGAITGVDLDGRVMFEDSRGRASVKPEEVVWSADERWKPLAEENAHQWRLEGHGDRRVEDVAREDMVLNQGEGDAFYQPQPKNQYEGDVAAFIEDIQDGEATESQWVTLGTIPEHVGEQLKDFNRFDRNPSGDRLVLRGDTVKHILTRHGEGGKHIPGGGAITADELASIGDSLAEMSQVLREGKGRTVVEIPNGRTLVIEIGEKDTTSVTSLYQEGAEPAVSAGNAARSTESSPTTPETIRNNRQSASPIIGQSGQSWKGKVTFLDATGKAVIEFSRASDISTAVHELAHVARRMAYEFKMWTEPQRAAVEKWAGVKDGKWTVEAEETFARGVESYVTKAGASTKIKDLPYLVREAFKTLAQAMKRIYRGVENSPLLETMPKDVKAAMDDLFGAEQIRRERAADAASERAEADAIRAEEERRAALLNEANPDDPRLDVWGDAYDPAYESEIKTVLGYGPDDSRPVEDIIEAAHQAQMYAEAMADYHRENDGGELMELRRIVKEQRNPNAADSDWVKVYRRGGKWFTDKRPNQGAGVILFEAESPWQLDYLDDFVARHWRDGEYVMARRGAVGKDWRNGGDRVPDVARRPSEVYEEGKHDYDVNGVNRGTRSVPVEIWNEFAKYVESEAKGTTLYQQMSGFDAEHGLPDGTYEKWAFWAETEYRRVGGRKRLKTEVMGKFKASEEQAGAFADQFMRGRQDPDPSKMKPGDKVKGPIKGMEPEEFRGVADDLAVWAAGQIPKFGGDKGAIRKELMRRFGLGRTQATEVLRRTEEVAAMQRIVEVYDASGGSYSKIKEMLTDEFPEIRKNRYRAATVRAMEINGTPVATRPRFTKDEFGRKVADEGDQVIVLGGQDVMVPAELTRDINQMADRMPKMPMGWNEGRLVEQISERSKAIYEWLVTNREKAVTAMTQDLMWYRDALKDVYGDKLKDKGFRAAVQKAAEGLIVDENGHLVNYMIDDLKAERPNDWEKVLEVGQWHKARYDEMLGQVNAVRKRFNMPQIPARRDYFTHMAEEATLWEQLMGAERFATSVTTPGRNSVYNPFQNQRKGNRTRYDSLANFEAYTDVTMRQIHLTEPTVRRRVFSKVIQGKILDKQWGDVARYFEETANELAGQKVLSGGTIENFTGNTRTGRIVNNWVGFVGGRLANNVVTGSLRTALMQMAQLPVAVPMVGARNLATGAMSQVLGHLSGAPNMAELSPFLKRRYGYKGPLATDFTTEYRRVVGKPMEFIEENVTTAIWHGAHRQAMEAGMTGADAVKHADKLTERIVGGRAIGEQGPIYRSQVGRLVTQFQYEVGNFVELVRHDLNWDEVAGRQLTTKEKQVRAAQMLISLWVANTVYEQVLGDTPLPDPLRMVEDMIGTMQRKDMGVGPKILAVAGRAAGEILSNVPGGQTAAGMIPDAKVFGSISRRDLFGRTNVGSFGGGMPLTEQVKQLMMGDDFVDWALNVTMMLGLPGGGGQIRKSVEGAQAVTAGKVTDRNGKERFKVEGPVDSAKTVLFGKYSTTPAREWLERIRGKQQG